jgi:hypothetical protein
VADQGSPATEDDQIDHDGEEGTEDESLTPDDNSFLDFRPPADDNQQGHYEDLDFRENEEDDGNVLQEDDVDISNDYGDYQDVQDEGRNLPVASRLTFSFGQEGEERAEVMSDDDEIQLNGP